MRLSYEKILAMQDSVEKMKKLELMLLKLQFHGNTFFKANEEWKRLRKIYK